MHDRSDCEENGMQDGEDHLRGIGGVHDASSHSD